jgi:1-acyl-sn-glycerol-3-phosphate acyltransferase
MPSGNNSPQRSPAAVWAPPSGSILFEAFCRSFFTLYCPLHIEGQQLLPDEPFLLCSNHSSHADSAVLMTATGRRFREFALLGASDYFFYSTRKRWLLSKLMNVIPIDRRPGPRSLSACITQCQCFLSENGKCLILYPEGTRSPDGEMRKFKTGVGWLASELRIPIVPAFIEGTHGILPKGHSVPRSHRVTVRFGEAFSCETLLRRAECLRDQRRTITEHLARQIRRLMPEHLYEEFPAEVRNKG